MAKLKHSKNPFARRIRIVFTGLVAGSIMAVLSSPMNALFVYASTVAFLDVFVTLFLKNAYLDSLNPKHVKNLLKISLKDLKKYTVFTVFKRIIALGVLAAAVAVFSFNIPLSYGFLTGYFVASLPPLLFGKYFGVKLPTIIQYDPNSKIILDTSSTDIGSTNWWLNIDNKRP